MRKAVRYYEQRLAMYSFSKSTEAVKLILAQGYYFSNKQQKAIHLLNDVIASNADSD
jgi:outer membrane protein assembly factor BamD (BamD/ComL family)